MAVDVDDELRGLFQLRTLTDCLRFPIAGSAGRVGLFERSLSGWKRRRAGLGPGGNDAPMSRPLFSVCERDRRWFCKLYIFAFYG